MENQIWSLVLSIVGVTGFHFVGKKYWWAWWINVGCQVLWLAYALTSKQYGFLIGVAVYSVVFTKNAIGWTNDHRGDKATSQIIYGHNSAYDPEVFSYMSDYSQKDVDMTLALYNEEEKSRMQNRIRQQDREINDLKYKLNAMYKDRR